MSTERPWVACLCAAWCVACREYGATFAALAAQLGGEADFAWIDIEDDADALGDLDIENFPTLLIADASGARFFGPVMPLASTADRLIRGALVGALAADIDPALVEHVRALVPSRLVAPRPA
ncbi:MAG TPA: thioredoxin domain-containing protein [Caldimonas sp.]|nr:thioredoxin domain-containing protein [Caldimonas sp.]